MFCLYVIPLFFLFFFFDWLLVRLRGDCDLALNTNAIQNATRRNESQGQKLSFDLPLENRSLKEQALVIYAEARLLPRDKESKLENKWTKIGLAENPRKDGYFEATLVKPGKRVPLRIEILFEGKEAVEKLSRGSELPIEVSYSYYGRNPMTTDHVTFSIPVDLFKEGAGVEAPASTKAKTPAKGSVFPIPTHLIFPHEDLSQVILHYTKGMFKPGDWVVIAESVVAIAQGRVYPVDAVHPGFWARRLNRCFRFDSSMASPYSLQCAIMEVGLPRIMLATIAGLVGRLLGRSGDFYRVAGRNVATIDDCTGTLPPFDKSVVMGPKNANLVASEIQRKTGYEVAIVDANDLRKVDILGKTSGIIGAELTELIRDNPQGNADEQTPIVMIRRN